MQAVSRTISIAASPESVWEGMVDVERWPLWASYMKSLARLDSGPLKAGSRVKVTPKGMPGSIWTVTDYEPGRSYTWASRPAPGFGMTGGHVVEARGDGATATFKLAATGPVGAALSPLLGIVFRRNTRLASEGLKRYCEHQS